jgi:hypothetical protein
MKATQLLNNLGQSLSISSRGPTPIESVERRRVSSLYFVVLNKSEPPGCELIPSRSWRLGGLRFRRGIS